MFLSYRLYSAKISFILNEDILKFFYSEIGKVVADICRKDPCENIARAVVGTCIADGEFDFSCQCQFRNKWNDDTNSCVPCKHLFLNNAFTKLI